MAERITIGARVRVEEADCCISFHGEGIVEAILYADQEDDWDEVPEEQQAWRPDDILSVRIGGITMKGESHPLGLELAGEAPAEAS